VELFKIKMFELGIVSVYISELVWVYLPGILVMVSYSYFIQKRGNPVLVEV
jgi:hypothetical protein